MSKSLEFYGCSSPNVVKVQLLLKELNVPFNYHDLNIRKGDQYAPEFLAINPNGKLPALVDNTVEGEPITVFESGNILLYLATKYNKLIPSIATDPRGHNEVLNWLFWQMANLGPNFGNYYHFVVYATERYEYPTNRYFNELRRLFHVINLRVADRKFIAGDEYTIADIAIFPWARYIGMIQDFKQEEFPNLFAYTARIKEIPSVQAWIAYEEELKAKNPAPAPPTEEERKIMFVNISKKLYGYWRYGVSAVLTFIDKNYFYRFHFTYFIIVGFLGGCLLMTIEGVRTKTAFIDCLFMSYSALTNTGLVTIDIAKWSTLSHMLLLLEMQLGSTVMLTLPVVILRRFYLRKAYRTSKVISHVGIIDQPLPGNKIPYPSPTNSDIQNDAILIADRSSSNSSSEEQLHHFENDHHFDDLVLITEGTFDSQPLSITPGSTLETNIEYRSLGKLLYILPCYQLSIYAVGFVLLGSITSGGALMDIMETNHIDNWWWSFFNTISSFNNTGISLLSDNIIPFNNYPMILLSISLLVALGNTLFPVFLRLTIHILRKLTKDTAPYDNLLNNPRTCFTHLFQARQTAILLAVWFIFNISQIAMMAILETNDRAFSHMTSGITFTNYLFTSINTRTGGFNSIEVNLLSSSVLLLVLGLMFVSSYPFVISLKGSAVNGKYTLEDNNTKSVMKDLLIRDIFILYICILLIGIIEEDRLDHDNPHFTAFHVIFEVVSAFGTVGLSIGKFGTCLSFSGDFHTASKLVVIVVMLLGKHRSLPDSIDNAVAVDDKSILSKLWMRAKQKNYYHH
eukprot:gene4951-5751_t